MVASPPRICYALWALPTCFPDGRSLAACPQEISYSGICLLGGQEEIKFREHPIPTTLGKVCPSIILVTQKCAGYYSMKMQLPSPADLCSGLEAANSPYTCPDLLALSPYRF